MKSPFVTLTLIATSSLALAQPQTEPVRIAKAQSEPLPDAQQLMDNLFAPYEAARTFRGTFEVSIKAERNSIAEIQLDSLFRYDDKDNLQRQMSRMKVIGRAKPKEQQTILFVDDGQNQVIVLVEQKVWWNVGSRDNSAALFSMVKPLVEQVMQALENDDDFSPVVNSGTAAGRAIYILSSKKNKDFRAVLDAPTRQIRSLAVKNTLSIDATNQVFDAPIADAEFEWNAPADYRQVTLGEVLPPASLGITVPGLAATPTG